MFMVQTVPTDAVTIIYNRPYCTTRRFFCSGLFHWSQNNSKHRSNVFEWHVEPLLGNTFPRTRICRQQSDNSHIPYPSGDLDTHSSKRDNQEIYTKQLLGLREFVCTHWSYDGAPKSILQEFECCFLFFWTEVVKLWHVITLDAGN